VRILNERSRRLRKAAQIDDAELWKRVADAAVTLLRSRDRVKIVANDTSDGTF
jgi:ribosomal protein L18E